MMTASYRPLTVSSYVPLFVGLALVAGCETSSEAVTGTNIPALSSKPACPGHPSCKDPPAPAGDATVDVSGDVITLNTQPVVIGKDTKNFLEVSGAGVDNTLVDELSLKTSAGSPSPAALGDCVTDPGNLAAVDPSAVQRLIDRLDDAAQERTSRFKVDRKDPANMTGAIVHSWLDDGDGHRYRTRIIESSLRPDDLVSVSEGPADVFTYTGGSIVSWDTGTGEALACPNAGTVTVVLSR